MTSIWRRDTPTPPYPVTSKRHLWKLGGAALAAVLALGACAANAPQDTLQPDGPIGRQINDLWWPVFWIAVAIFFLVEGVLLFSLFKFRERRGKSEPAQVHGNTRIEILWTIAPALLLAFVAVATVNTIFAIDKKPEGDFLTVKVVGHQWWWEYQYPEEGIVTANELHIPTDKPVLVELESADVIHSFWVPKLAGKQDVVPGRTNHLTLLAEQPGTYLGQCAEFCGLSHANMRLVVIAEEPSEFNAWVDDQTAEAESPDDALAAEGERLFMTGECVRCHAIGGTDAQARLAPDLTHFSSRARFAGAILENTDANLTAWLDDPPALKPMLVGEGTQGIGMPDYNLSGDEIRALVAYLRTLN